MNVKEEIRSQFIGALLGAKFPIYTPEELLNAMSASADTCCKGGDIEMTAELSRIFAKVCKISHSAVPRKRQTRSLSGQGCNQAPYFFFYSAHVTNQKGERLVIA